MWQDLYCVFIYSLLIKKDICDCWNISLRLTCVYVCLSSGDFFIFFGKSFLFLFLYLCYLYFGTSTFHMANIKKGSLVFQVRLKDQKKLYKYHNYSYYNKINKGLNQVILQRKQLFLNKCLPSLNPGYNDVPMS